MLSAHRILKVAVHTPKSDGYGTYYFDPVCITAVASNLFELVIQKNMWITAIESLEGEISGQILLKLDTFNCFL